MRPIARYHFAFLVLVTACAPAGQSLSDADRATIAAAVDSATRAFQAAERARDAEATIAHMATDFYMYNDGVRSDYESVVASIRGTMGSFAHFEPHWTNLEVKVLGPDAALVTLVFRDSIVTVTGETMRLTGPTTLVWERRGADWLITFADADHYPVGSQ